MKLINKLKRIEFEARIFVSFSIVILVCAISFLIYGDHSPIYKLLFRSAGMIEYSRVIFLFAAIMMMIISALRMWAGSLLSSKTVMSFKVQSDSLIISGPYQLVRNPIYFSDWLAMCVFSLFLPFSGVLLSVLFYLHYIQLIKYEEESFNKNFTTNYNTYLDEVPRLIASPKSLIKFLKSNQKIYLNLDGIRHNALFVLFIPGFIVGYFTNSFLYAVLIGIPAVIDWAVVHTKIGLPKSVSKNSIKKKSKVFRGILYSQCWEDPQLDRLVFNITPDDVVFSITSGGCNLLSFLIDDPGSVIALDLNPNQNHLLELKMASFRHLSYEQMLEFIGVRNSNQRLKYYNKIKTSLSSNAVDFWDSIPDEIENGILHCGRYEKYMKLLRVILRILVGKRIIEKFYLQEDPTARLILYECEWNTLRWKVFTRILLSRATMSLLFDKAFFKYLKSDFSFGKHFAEKTKRALTQLPVKQNYFLRYILFGNYDEKYLPPYLKKENFDKIKSRLNRIKIVTDSCDRYFSSLPDNSISKFNFTNIFEWISENEFDNLLKETARVAKNNAAITYRNLLVPRNRPDILAEKIYPQNEIARYLYSRDLSFIYDNYIVERIVKEKKLWNTESLKYHQNVS